MLEISMSDKIKKVRKSIGLKDYLTPESYQSLIPEKWKKLKLGYIRHKLGTLRKID